MPIRDVVTMGFGFSGVFRIPVLGYGVADDETSPVIPGAELALDGKRTHYALTNERLHYRVDKPEHP